MKKQTEKTAQQKEEEFIPFGEEWQKQMMKMDKKDLVRVIKKIAIENCDMQYEIINLKSLENRNMGKIEKTISDIFGSHEGTPKGMKIVGRGKITKSPNKH